MQKNTISIIIKKSVDEVFEFTTNPKNTPLWFSTIKEEIANEYPPKIGTRYKNCGDDNNWSVYEVSEFEKNRLFVLSDLNKNYNVKYLYTAVGNNETKMEYQEWTNNGELKNPASEMFLQKLKFAMENKKIIN